MMPIVNGRSTNWFSSPVTMTVTMGNKVLYRFSGARSPEIPRDCPFRLAVKATTTGSADWMVK